MKTTVKNTIEAITDYITSLNDDEVINLHNQYCQSCNYSDNEIYENEDEFFETYFQKPLEAIRSVFYGDYRYMDKYVMFNGYGNLESFNYPEKFIDFPAIADRILEHPEDFYDIELEEEEETEEE